MQRRTIHCCLLLRDCSRVFLRHVIKSSLKRLKLALRLDLDVGGGVFAGLLNPALFFRLTYCGAKQTRLVLQQCGTQAVAQFSMEVGISSTNR